MPTKVLVYRVEKAKNGAGPFMAGKFNCEVTSETPLPRRRVSTYTKDWNIEPCFPLDLIEACIDSYCFGCQRKEMLLNWFTKNQVSRLEAQGFVVRMYKVEVKDMNYVPLGKQAMFKKAHAKVVREFKVGEIIC